ncbi:MAG: precorrin-6Y C5,15-methyltransferase (decarboxylating) subunit CbiT [Desulfurispora sp.]|uniref:precorrin-6Y C5,15-methyltransferase (decarboxylating) subunit CbiT n=1 Tax=Desulfurispora sp. TaxID=3014275 RepID=UPI00404A7EB6
MNKDWPYITPGLPDGMFSRVDGVPMTGEEVRTVMLAKARLARGQVIWDIGSGTGTLSVEAARLARDSTVYAIESKPEAVRATAANVAAWELDNVRVVSGAAPGALRDLPAPDRVFIGGSGGRLVEIINLLADRLQPGGRLVLSAVTVETLQAALQTLVPPIWQREIIQLAVVRERSLGRSHLWQARNPVFLITAWRE